MHDLPSGTVTFLFTDIEGSTRRWDAQRAAMSGALARHDDLLRAAIESNGGHVFKTVGDAFCAAFGSASAALTAAVDAQRALAAEDWSAFGTGSGADAGSDLDADRATDFATLRVRMALHTGQAEQRDGDYFGPPLNRVARLLSTGHGGQVLLSQTAFDLVRDDLPPGATLRDMGEHRLKDLFRPERIFQLVAPDLVLDFPALKTLDNRPNNLPVQPTSFVGREREVAAIKVRLATARLLTLTGVGGTGKTRLALQAAADVLDDYPDGVWFVDLAPIVDPVLVAQTVATALGVSEQPGRPMEATLVDHLRVKQALIVLDNCEHLIEVSAAVAAELVRSTQGVRVLATSREALGVTAETTYSVPTLGLPEAGAPVATDADLRALAQYEAVRLFIDRGVAVKSDFAVTNANAPSVAAICHQLDGIPLAIELAAARVKHMPPEQILARLDQRFRLLTGGGRDRLPRQQTLAAAIDWSHGLLDEAEQALFRRLSVFRGGWTLEAAERVCGGDPVEVWEVVDVLLRLVDKSLVVAGELGGEARYRFLETVREYARAKLIGSGERESMQVRHMAHCIVVVASATAHLRSEQEVTWYRRLEADNDNFRAAMQWATGATAGGIDALRLAAVLGQFWGWSGYFTDSSQWLGKALSVAPADAPSRLLAQVGYWLGHARAGSDPAFAESAFQESLDRARQAGDRQTESWCLNDLGLLALRRGDLESARVMYEASTAIKREDSEGWDVAISLANLAEVALELGDADAATRYCDEATAASRTSGTLGHFGDRIVALQRGDIHLATGRPEAARERYAAALAMCHAFGERVLIGELLARQAFVSAEQEQWSRAARLMGATDALFEAIGTSSGYLLVPRRHACATAAARAGLGDAAFDAAYAAGRAMGADEAVAYALGNADE